MANLIAGNWKMNKTAKEAAEFVRELKPLIKDSTEEVALCVPFTCLESVGREMGDSGIKLGAQDMFWLDKGAYTGEISAEMLLDLGVEYVIIGHSERRKLFGDTDETVNNKLKAAIRHGLKPILCVGESLETRQAGITREFIKGQIRGAFEDLKEEEVAEITIAYEPIWAIGTGLTATPEQAGETTGIIKRFTETLYNKSVADKVRVLYGGSMNASNAEALLQQKTISGGLIGGASLKPVDFAAIVNHGKN